MSIYMKVPGIDGSVTAKGYEKWIEVDSMQFGVGRAVSMTAGNMANRLDGLPSFSEITISKQSDDATYGLLNESVLGKAVKEVTLVVVDSGEAPTEYVKYLLKDSLFSSYSMSAGSGGRPNESVSISYAFLEVSFATHTQANTAGGVPRVAYDLAAGTKG